MNEITKFEPQTLSELKEYAEVMSLSGIIPKDFQGKPANILVAIQWGSEIGLKPLQALQNIAVINGKPAIYGDSMLALVKAHKNFAGCSEWFENDTAYCEIKRLLPTGDIESTKRSFSVAEAKEANLLGKPGPWKSYRNRMLQMRARGFAIRDAFPDAIKGLITSEEAADFPAEDTQVKEVAPKVENATSVEGLINAISERRPEPIDEPPVDEAPGWLDDEGEDNVIDVEAIDPEPKLQTISLVIPQDGEPDKKLEFETEAQWLKQYNEIMKQMYDYRGKDIPEAKLRQKLKEIKNANKATLESFENQELVAMAENLRLKYIRGLSAAENELLEKIKLNAEAKQNG